MANSISTRLSTDDVRNGYSNAAVASAPSDPGAGDSGWMRKLTPEQRAVIESENWHHLIAHWFVGGCNVRLVWDDGESYILYVDGEMDDITNKLGDGHESD